MSMFYLGPIVLKVLSHSSIFYHPSEPLVIQVEAGGEYAGIQWTRTPIALNVSSDELVDFQQTFMRTVTSEEDWGLYLVYLVSFTPNTISTRMVNITVLSKCLNSDLHVKMDHLIAKWILINAI